MSAEPDIRETPFRRALPWLGLFVGALGLRLVFVTLYPSVYSWDAFDRLWWRDSLLVHHWLPLPQVPVLLLGSNLVLLRGAYSIVGAASSVVIGLAVAGQRDRSCGLLAGWLMATLPLSVVWSIVPYQEGFLFLFLGAVLVLWPCPPARANRRSWFGAAVLALACCCRYEMWILAAVYGVLIARRHRARELRLLLPAAIVIAAWTAYLWFGGAFQAGVDRVALSSSDATASGVSLAAVSLLRTASMVANEVGWPILLAAVWGGWEAWNRRRPGAGVLHLFLALNVLLLIGRVASSDGIPTGRMVATVGAVSVIFASIGWSDLAARVPERLTPWIVKAPALALAMVFVVRADSAIWERDRFFAEERSGVALLRGLPAGSRVAILPRTIPNRWHGEGTEAIRHSVRTLFAQDPGLRRTDLRWLFPGQDGEAFEHLPEYFVEWEGGLYRSSRLSEDEARVVGEKLRRLSAEP